MHAVFPLIIMKSILIVFIVCSVCDEENSYKTKKNLSWSLAQKTPDFSPINFV